MGVRLLVMFSVMCIELGCGIAAILGVTDRWEYRQTTPEIAGVVMLVVGIIVAWLLTIAFFVRKSSRVKSVRIVDDARAEAAKILNDATDKALALCSLDGSRCQRCGNPRTGKFCPKCGMPGNGIAA
jgi:hypothetical protein